MPQRRVLIQVAVIASVGLLASCTPGSGTSASRASGASPSTGSKSPHTVEPTGDVLTLHILHTNDFHGQIRPVKAVWKKELENPPYVGGAHAVAGYVKKQRAELGDRMLFLDAGDIFQGTPEGNLSEGQVVVALLNHLRTDAVAVGNHDFDLGEPKLHAMVKRSHFPWLAANLIDKRTDKPLKYVRPFIMKVVQGVKVGIVGLAPGDLHQLCVPWAVKDMVVTEEYEAANRAAAMARKRGAEIVLLLTHIGVTKDKRLARELKGIDAIIGGHSHTGIEETWIADETGTLVAQTHGKSTGIGHVELDFDLGSRRVVAKRSKLVELMALEWPPDRDLASVLHPYVEDIERRMAEEVGISVDAMLRTKGHNTSPIGNLITDVMRKVSGADVALHNKTGIRSDLPEGILTLRDLWRVCPFGNTITVLEMTGRQLKEALDFALSRSYVALEISGAHVRGQPGAPPGRRIKAIEVGGEVIEDHKMYKVATNSFLATGGDGHRVLGEAQQIKWDAPLLRDAIIDHVRQHSPLRALGDQRVEVVD